MVFHKDTDWESNQNSIYHNYRLSDDGGSTEKYSLQQTTHGKTPKQVPIEAPKVTINRYTQFIL